MGQYIKIMFQTLQHDDGKIQNEFTKIICNSLKSWNGMLVQS
jgi:hypothetical protein